MALKDFWLQHEFLLLIHKLLDYRGLDRRFQSGGAANALCSRVHAALWFCKHLDPSELQRVPTRSPVQQLPFQVHTAYLPPLAAQLATGVFPWGQRRRVYRHTHTHAHTVKPIQPPVLDTDLRRKPLIHPHTRQFKVFLLNIVSILK